MPIPRTYRTVALALVIFFSVTRAQNIPITYYVSPDGNDHWSGTLSGANQNNTDGPFATLERARDAVRSARTRGKSGGTATVYIRGGVYHLHQTLSLDQRDSGTGKDSVIWRAYPAEDVTLSGGTQITGWRSLSDATVRQRLDPAVVPHLVQIDLRASQVQEFGTITPRGGPPLELFFQQKRMTPARWPNDGWLHIADVPQNGPKRFNDGLEREKRFDGVPIGRHYGRITYSESRPARWSKDNEVYVHGYWTFDWSDSYQRIQSIDTLAHELTLAEPHHGYGYTKNQRYYFLNVLEELDAPGEWYLDRKAGTIYFWPPAPLQTGDLQVSILDQPMIAMDSVSFLTFRDIHFDCSRGRGITVSGCRNVVIGGCTFRNLGGDAVVITGGTGNGVRGCDISDVALGGIRLGGGDRKTLVPGNNYASNNHIHHYSTWLRTGQYAVFIEGVGQRLDHSLIHNAPFEAIYLRGNEHLVEYNEVHHVTQETGDAGALHTGRDWTWRGNTIRYNYFHHLLGPGLHGVMGVYLDDFSSGFTVFGNLFYKAGRASMIGGGRDNTFENNMYVECAPSVHVDARGLSWAGYYFNGGYPVLFQLMDSVHYDRPPYSTRYPELLTLYADSPAVPKNNRILRNISWGGRWIDIYDYNDFNFSAAVTMKDNVIADSVVCRRRDKAQKGWDPYYLDIDTREGYVALKQDSPEMRREFSGNLFLSTNPGIRDPHHGDFHLLPDSPALKFGFKPIPLEEIGLRNDEFRQRLDAP
jgi:hypothetical protein